MAGVRKFRNPDDWATVVAYDPGGTTGWAVLSVDKSALSEGKSILSSIHHRVSGEIVGDMHKQYSEMISLLDFWPDAAVVGEDFTVRQFNQADYFLHPVRVNAVVDNHLNLNQGKKLFLQQPSMAKSTINDLTLKNYKMYHPKSPHARDASRHALTFIRRAQSSKALRVQAWPKLYY
jgi:hypothetical protein